MNPQTTEPMEALVETLNSIHQRINGYPGYLAGGETRTRQLLIDPLLSAMGWDVQNPKKVRLENPLQAPGGTIRADYVLLNANGNDLAAIEAKKLGARLDDKVTNQVFSYADEKNCQYMIVTDGDKWRIYNCHKNAARSEKLEVEIQVTRIRSEVAADDLCEFLYGKLTGSPSSVDVAIINPSYRGVLEMGITQSNSGWLALNDKHLPTKLTGYRGKIHVQFNNGQHKVNKLSKMMQLVINELLIKSGNLTSRDCPIQLGKSGDRYLVHTEAIHANGSHFSATQKLSNGLFLFNGLSAQDMVNKLCGLLKQFHVDPAIVRIQLDN